MRKTKKRESKYDYFITIAKTGNNINVIGTTFLNKVEITENDAIKISNYILKILENK